MATSGNRPREGRPASTGREEYANNGGGWVAYATMTPRTMSNSTRYACSNHLVWVSVGLMATVIGCSSPTPALDPFVDNWWSDIDDR